MKIRLISLLLIFSACFSNAFADIVVGRVVDAQTKAPLPDAQIEVQQHFMGALISSSYTTDSLGVFELQAFSRQCVLSVEYLGYYRVRRNFLASEGEDTIRLGKCAALLCTEIPYSLTRALLSWTKAHGLRNCLNNFQV